MSNAEYKMMNKGRVLDFCLYSWSKLSFSVDRTTTKKSMKVKGFLYKRQKKGV